MTQPSFSMFSPNSCQSDLEAEAETDTETEDEAEIKPEVPSECPNQSERERSPLTACLWEMLDVRGGESSLTWKVQLVNALLKRAVEGDLRAMQEDLHDLARLAGAFGAVHAALPPAGL